MLNILFDLITTQLSFGGGSEYTRKVFYYLNDRISCQNLEVQLIGVIDSSIRSFQYPDLTPEELSKKGIKVLDIKNESIIDIVHNHGINKIFIGVLQFWAGRYSLSNIDCEIITIIHDMHDEEMENIKLYPYLAFFRSPYAVFRQLTAIALKCFKHKILNKRGKLSIIIDSLRTSKNWKCITVSEYTKHALRYYYNVPEEKISVLYSPERIMCCTENIENNSLRDIINKNFRYYLIVSANRPEKNALRAVKAFLRYRQLLSTKSSLRLPYVVTLGSKRSIGTGHISLPQLSESDLVMAYKSCYALIYPSFFEGFGYPPVEAMKFDKPVLASNVTSIPEILGNAPIYFSPFFKSDIFRSLCRLNDENYKEYSLLSRNRYRILSEIQKKDLDALINVIVK